MEQWLSASAAQPRLNAVLVAVFACVAMLMAAIGVYGVLSYSVNQRTREIGLRMAMGAPRASVLRLIVREGMLVALAGIVAGLVGALGVSRVLASLLYGVPAARPGHLCGSGRGAGGGGAGGLRGAGVARIQGGPDGGAAMRIAQ